MALFYVGRFATSRAKLTSYLKRKIRERGWDGGGEPDVEAVTERLVRLGYIDDRGICSVEGGHADGERLWRGARSPIAACRRNR